MNWLCTPRNEVTERSLLLDKILRASARQEAQKVKILLLGPGESGKSTLFKQMKVLQLDGGFSVEELLEHRQQIQANTLSQMKVVANNALTVGIANPKTKEIAKRLLNNKDWSSDVGVQIKTLWRDKDIRKAFARGGVHYQLDDSAKYLFDNIDRIKTPNYIPSQDDVIRARKTTSGVVESEFKFENMICKIIDVGGQRAERRHWIHQFDGVSCVIFCVAMSEYDQVLREDETCNRMQESLDLFAEIANCKWFQRTTMFLFLNKMDLFQEKIQRVNLNVCFPEFTGGNNIDAAVYVKAKFLEVSHRKNPVIPHFTCAINTENIDFVFDSVRQTILKSMVDEIGFGYRPITLVSENYDSRRGSWDLSKDFSNLRVNSSKLDKMDLLIKYKRSKKKITCEAVDNIDKLLDIVVDTFKSEITFQKNQISLQYYDNDFNEYVDLENINDIPKKGKLKVLTLSKSSVTPDHEINSEDILVETEISAGAFGSVYCGLWNKSTTVALKKLHQVQIEDFNREAKMLMSLRHPNIVSYYGVTKINSDWYIVMEFMPCKALNKLLQKLKQEVNLQQLLKMVHDAACGMLYLHKMKVIHRDLAARNLLVKLESNNYLVKVADFGMARAVPPATEVYSAIESKFAKKWAAPEVIKTNEFSLNSDVYSFGICMWEILEYGTVPFPDYSNSEAMRRVLTGERPQKPKNCPPKVFHLMQQCWDENPSQRPDFENISQVLNFILRDFVLEKTKTLEKQEKPAKVQSDSTEVSSITATSKGRDPDSTDYYSDNPKESKGEKEDVKISVASNAYELAPVTSHAVKTSYEDDQSGDYDDNFRISE